MSATVKNIEDAIYTKLNGTSTFKTAVGGRISSTIADPNETLPHAVFTVISNKYFRVFGTNDDSNVRVQIDVYVPKTSGKSVLADIMQKLETLMDMTACTVTGYAHSVSWSDEAYVTSVEGKFLRARSEYIVYSTVH